MGWFLRSKQVLNIFLEIPFIYPKIFFNLEKLLLWFIPFELYLVEILKF